jgi:hypothetical protein
LQCNTLEFWKFLKRSNRGHALKKNYSTVVIRFRK